MGSAVASGWVVGETVGSTVATNSGISEVHPTTTNKTAISIEAVYKNLLGKEEILERFTVGHLCGLECLKRGGI